MGSSRSAATRGSGIHDFLNHLPIPSRDLKDLENDEA